MVEILPWKTYIRCGKANNINGNTSIMVMLMFGNITIPFLPLVSYS